MPKLNHKDLADALAKVNLNPWEPELVKQLYCDDQPALLDACVKLRQLFSDCHQDTYTLGIAAGIIPRLAELLKTSPVPAVQFEVCWALTNVASGNELQTDAVVGADVVPTFIELLSSPNVDLQEQSAWAIGNVVGGSTKYRDMVLHRQGLKPILALLDTPSPVRLSLIKNATWTLSNLIRGKPKPVLNDPELNETLRVLNKLLLFEDDDVLTDALWALSYLSDGTTFVIQKVLESGIIPRVIKLMNHHNPGVLTPALRAAANVVSGDDLQTQYMIDCGMVGSLGQLIKHSKKGIAKESCWALSNILAGNSAQIEIVKNMGIVPELLKLFSAPADIKKEAVWAICNMTAGASSAQMEYLNSVNGLRIICDSLDEKTQPNVLPTCLEGVENFLRMESRSINAMEREYALIIERCEGLVKLETLQRHSSAQVRDKAASILQTFFAAEDEEPDP